MTAKRVAVINDVVGARRVAWNELGKVPHSEVAFYPTKLAGVDLHVPVIGLDVTL